VVGLELCEGGEENAIGLQQFTTVLLFYNAATYMVGQVPVLSYFTCFLTLRRSAIPISS